MAQKYHQKGFAPIVIILILGLIGGSVFMAIRNNVPTQAVPSPTPTVSPTPTSSSSPSTKPSFPPTAKPSQAHTSTNPTPVVTPIPISTPSPSVQSSVYIDSISPSSGKVGDEFIIKGSGFGKSSFYYPDPTKFQGMISFYGPSGQNSGGAPWGCEWCKDNWSDNQIKARVPGVATGVTFQVEVTSSDGQKSNRVSFKVSN